MLKIITTIINLVFYAIEALLLMRFVLVLFSANISGSFARWIFANSAPLIAPFRNIFPSIDLAGLIIDFTTLFALVVYAVIGQLIVRVLYSVGNPR